VKFTAIFFLGTALTASPCLAGPKFTTVDVEGVFTIVTGLNQSGAVTGSYDDADLSAHGFLRTPDGTVTKFDAVSGSHRTVPAGINDDDAVTGNYTDPDTGFAKGFVRDPAGNIATFDATDGTGQTFASAINKKGEVTGFYIDGTGNTFAFVRSAKGKIDSFTVDGAGAQPTGINNKRMVTGTAFGDQPSGFVRNRDKTAITFTAAADGHGTESNAINDAGWTGGRYADSKFKVHGFLRNADGKVITVDVPDAKSTSVLALNQGHDSAGRWDDAKTFHSFVRKANNRYFAFDPPKAVKSMATDINDDGVVAGNYEKADGISRGYIRTP